jgi:Holliday junction resolvase RusA-like endonuclease
MKGAGIHPILLSSYVYFIRAEAALALNTSDDPKTMLEMGVRSSIEKVINFDPSTIGNSHASTQADIDAYVKDVLNVYDNASDDSERMEVIIREFYVASWGNQVEAYNSYRRTGKPGDLQPTLLTNAGAFIRSFKYPSVTIDVNTNINSKPDQTQRVFWDLGNYNLDF